ncbi:MAG TPA: SpoIIE family protein phosphatase [Planctomycetia bacterium]|nr:SpoIIE family protein phosphatase [Planctomycetia bacterium]
MPAQFQVLSGAATGTKYELAKAETRIGRHPDCEVKIDLSAASRFHAHIIKDGEQHYIEDLGSRNKTYVNGKPIESKTLLRDNDRVKICDILFVFHQPNAAESEENDGTTVLTSIDASGSSDNLFRVRPEAKLKAIVEISQALGSELEVAKLLPKILDGLLRVFPQADRVQLIQRDEQDRLLPRAFRHRRGNEDSARFSRTIVRWAMDQRKAFLSDDPEGDSRFQLSSSLVDLRIRSVMVAPLLVPDRPALGALLVDTQSNTQRFKADDLEILVAVANQVAVAVDNAQLHQATLLQERVERELKLAREVQKSFLPSIMPKYAGMDFWAYYEAAGAVGGDYYDFVPLPNGKLAVLLGDVSGKGVPAALLMAKASSDAKVALMTFPDAPARAMEQINDSICAAGLEGKFMTLCLCVVDPKAPDLAIVNAGHMSPVIRRADGRLDEPADPDRSGPPVGVVPGMEWGLVKAELHPGDSVVIFSDGISEAMNPTEQEYGMERLRGIVRDTYLAPQELGKRILADVHTHVSGHKQHDDMTLVSFGRAGA